MYLKHLYVYGNSNSSLWDYDTTSDETRTGWQIYGKVSVCKQLNLYHSIIKAYSLHLHTTRGPTSALDSSKLSKVLTFS